MQKVEPGNFVQEPCSTLVRKQGVRLLSSFSSRCSCSAHSVSRASHSWVYTRTANFTRISSILKCAYAETSFLERERKNSWRHFLETPFGLITNHSLRFLTSTCMLVRGECDLVLGGHRLGDTTTRSPRLLLNSAQTNGVNDAVTPGPVSA